jgi:hypothetical protein
MEPYKGYLSAFVSFPLYPFEADASYRSAQALRHVLDAATWRPASQTFYRVGDRPTEAGSALVN